MALKRWQKTDRPAPRQGAGSGRRGVGLRARLEASASPQGAFSHENYPSKEIEACLAACREAAVRRGPIGRRLRAQVESCAREHAELAEELAAFSRRTEELRLRIIALTAAAKPLQEPGIGAGDREACLRLVTLEEITGRLIFVALLSSGGMRAAGHAATFSRSNLSTNF